MPARSVLALLFTLGLTTLPSAADQPPLANISDSLAALTAVGPEGEGNEAAAAAWNLLVTEGQASLLPDLLSALDAANPLAANWIASAAETVAAREQKARHPLPLPDLGEILLDTGRSPRARRLAFDLISTVEPAVAERLVPGFLNDPAPQLRRPAVQLLLDEAARLDESGKAGPAILIYSQALQAARDIDQIDRAAQRLDLLGQDVDLPRHFGFLTHWKVLGPFQNTGRSGFATVFPPEESVALGAAYPGKDAEVRWQDYATSDRHGMVDLNKPLGMLKEVTGYAYTEFVSDSTRPAELRLGSKNAWKVWLNGEYLFGRDEYHRGMEIDQYRMPCQLREGRNSILVKLCQNEQIEEWTVEWQFQLRVCDASGTAILSLDRPPTPEATRRSSRRSASS